MSNQTNFSFYREIFHIAFAAVFKNKMRSFLTALGLIIGIMVVILMQATISAFQHQIEDSINQLGANGFIVSRWPAILFGGDDWQKYQKRQKISEDYIDKIKDYSEAVMNIIPLSSNYGQTISYKKSKSNSDVVVHGAVDGWQKIQQEEISFGRYFSFAEQKFGSNVVVISSELANTLFEKENPIGKEIGIDGYKLLIVGVFKKKGGLNGNSNSYAAVPWLFYKRIFGKDISLDLLVSAKNSQLLSKATDETSLALRMIRNVKFGEENDFEIITKDSLSSKVNNILLMIYLVSLAIGGMSIVVGSIGIMNIMLVSVTERTREIGIRRSLGATRSTIAKQFLIESTLLSVSGGLIGVLIGFTITTIVNQLTEWQTEISITAILVAFSISVFIGIISGLYPALKAAKLSPVDALRYE